MEIFIAVLGMILVNGFAAFLGYLAGCFKRADYFSEQLKVAQWHTEQAIQQRDAARVELKLLQTEINDLWAQGRRD